MLNNIEKLAALGALGVAGGSFAAWLGFLFAMRPVSTGGFDATSFVALTAASFLVVALMAAAHVWFGIQLRRGPDSIRG
ncbi:MAG: hypothetical protein WD771_02810 [Gemmatimonadaceae bacterium]